jgi:hypothetical protein
LGFSPRFDRSFGLRPSWHKGRIGVMVAFQTVLQWFSHHPLGAATVTFCGAVVILLAFSFLEAQLVDEKR